MNGNENHSTTWLLIHWIKSLTPLKRITQKDSKGEKIQNFNRLEMMYQ